jgi:UDP-N-acetylmuramoyl-tripeptide--D-alanyl-D-alanine ligase
VINADDPFSQRWASINTHCQTRYFGCHSAAEINASDIQCDAAGFPQFTLTTPTETGMIKLPLIGEYNVLNALAAAAVATALHIPLAQIQQGLAQAKSVENRMIKRCTPTGVHLLDDTYNANPMAMKMALNVLAQHPGETILVMGDMGELGEQAEHYHQQVGEQAKALGITRVYTYGALASLAARSFGVMGHHFDSSEALMQKLKQVKPGTCLLIKGSRSAHMEQFVTSLMT